MKKMSVFLVVLLALFIVLPASAQVHLGVLGGLNVAGINLDPDNAAVLSERIVFGFGGILGYGFSENVAIQVEPMYLQKGSDVRQQKLDAEFRLAYFEVPLMFKYAFDSGSDTRLYVKAGPIISFNRSSKLEVASVEVDLKDETKSVDFGLGFGAGVSQPVGNSSIFVEARYARGLTNINDDPFDPDTDIKTRGVQIFAGITFQIGSK